MNHEACRCRSVGANAKGRYLAPGLASPRLVRRAFRASTTTATIARFRPSRRAASKFYQLKGNVDRSGQGRKNLNPRALLVQPTNLDQPQHGIRHCACGQLPRPKVCDFCRSAQEGLGVLGCGIQMGMCNQQAGRALRCMALVDWPLCSVVICSKTFGFCFQSNAGDHLVEEWLALHAR